MSYELSDVELYQWGADSTFGATSVVHRVIGPRGKVGFVRDFLVDITTSLVGTTTVPEIMVGISSGDFTFGRYRLGTTVSAGYNVGAFRASQEQIVGNPPRVDTSVASKVVLDGGPLTSAGISGGTFLTVVPQGRIPASPMIVIGAVSGAASVVRLLLRDPLPVQLIAGQAVYVTGVQGSTGTSQGTIYNISAVNTTNNWIELSGTTFGGTYTGGGYVDLIVYITCAAGVGGSPAGGGYVRVKIQWIGPQEV